MCAVGGILVPSPESKVKIADGRFEFSLRPDRVLPEASAAEEVIGIVSDADGAGDGIDEAAASRGGCIGAERCGGHGHFTCVERGAEEGSERRTEEDDTDKGKSWCLHRNVETLESPRFVDFTELSIIRIS